MMLKEKLKVRAGKGFSYSFKTIGIELIAQCFQMEKVCTSPVYKVLRKKNKNENKYGNKSSGSYFVRTV